MARDCPNKGAKGQKGGAGGGDVANGSVLALKVPPLLPATPAAGLHAGCGCGCGCI